VSELDAAPQHAKAKLAAITIWPVMAFLVCSVAKLKQGNLKLLLIVGQKIF
jgi:hypothetical protein